MLATVDPDSPETGFSYMAKVVSERTTVALAAGRSCHGIEYGGGGAAAGTGGESSGV
jgi:hypothetical protein